MNSFRCQETCLSLIYYNFWVLHNAYDCTTINKTSITSWKGFSNTETNQEDEIHQNFDNNMVPDDDWRIYVSFTYFFHATIRLHLRLFKREKKKKKLQVVHIYVHTACSRKNEDGWETREEILPPVSGRLAAASRNTAPTMDSLVVP